MKLTLRNIMLRMPPLAGGVVCLWLVAACNLSTRLPVAGATSTPGAITAASTLPSASPQPTLTASVSPTATLLPSHTLTSTVSPTLTPSATASATITPTYAVIRGKVLQQANCRYGPGAPYLYKYGLYPETVLEIIGRNDLGTWVVVQAIGGSNPCWVKASLLELRGEVMSVAPMYLPLPQSPYYGSLSGVSAVREGNAVTVSWHPLILRAGDDSEQVPYVVEAWVCTQGELVFTPVGSYATLVTIQDESGCAQPSHARVAGAEKHGYTAWVEIPWP